MDIFIWINWLREAMLSQDESLHAVKVLRLKEGDPVLLVDGRESP